MTVKELIEALKEYPENYTMEIYDDMEVKWRVINTDCFDVFDEEKAVRIY